MSVKPEINRNLPPSVRGRNVVSKPLISASPSAKSSSLISSLNGNGKPQRLQRTQSVTASVTKAATPKVGKSASLNRIVSAGGSTRLNSKLTTTIPAMPESSSNTESTATLVLDSTPLTSESTKQQTPMDSLDPLQVAAQAYPWMYMTSTLEACFKTSEESITIDFENRESGVSQEEFDLRDQRIRFEAERAITFYDELGTDTFAQTAPKIMQVFHQHGDACTRLEAEALDLALVGSPDPDEEAPLQVYHDVLDRLEKLHAEAIKLEISIIELTSVSNAMEDREESMVRSARSQIIGVITACLPVLHARIMNISMAQELIDGAQENLSISLRMESLGLLDD